ncbi:MAG TPA: hypothetical protein DCR78_06195 [Pseudomonas sp.]|nr:hypothetical protein [Pseudomonas sp.]
MHCGNWHDAGSDTALHYGPRCRLHIGASAIAKVLLKMIVRWQRFLVMFSHTVDTAAYRIFTTRSVKCDELPLWDGFHAR